MCGIAGAYNIENAGWICTLMIKAMQHRGQEGFGVHIVEEKDDLSTPKRIWPLRGEGLVDEVINRVFGVRDRDEDISIEEYFNLIYPGRIAIAHTRYSTAGKEAESKEITRHRIQPLYRKIEGSKISLAHNGNFVNYSTKRAELEKEGAIFQSDIDTELLFHLFSRARGDFIQKWISVCREIDGSYSLLIITPEALYAIRDPYGFRPLAIGSYKEGFVVASETCAFDVIGANNIGNVLPGEMVIFNQNGLSRKKIAFQEFERRCIFCYIYFARPDSFIFGRSAGMIKRRIGAELAREYPDIEADVVISVPDSSNIHALAYAKVKGIPFEFGLIRNHYVGRTFITPAVRERELGVQLKLNPDREVIKGKRVTVVDDSIIRATTLRKIVKIIRQAGASEVHARIGSPPYKHPCFWGIDTPTEEELIASSRSVEEIKKEIGVDSLGYLSLRGLLNCVDDPDQKLHCVTCFSAEWPYPKK